MKNRSDIIAAQATPAGEGGIAIVRVSGKGCEALCGVIFRAKNGRPLEPRRLTFGHVIAQGEVIDEAMAVFLPAPHTYTREDVLEIHCHGSQALVSRILYLLMHSGVRMAEPGEFTYRAFVNGRIDLAQAEGVMRMIRAGSLRAMNSAVRQMEGGVSSFVRKAREEIISLLAAISASIDFPDEVEEEQTAQQVREGCEAIARRLRGASNMHAGVVEEEGLGVVFAGRPNAGKSSLLNALVGGDRAIVTDIPGTTRDTLTEIVQYDGVRLRLTDTAGLRKTQDAVERIGVERALRALRDADVRVLVADMSDPEGLEGDGLHGYDPDIVVMNKSDLPSVLTQEDVRARYANAHLVQVSAQQGWGVEALCALLTRYAQTPGEESEVLTQVRHVSKAMDACSALDEAAKAIEAGYPLDTAAVDLSAALDALGEITGETMNEKVIDEVFARFCVGK